MKMYFMTTRLNCMEYKDNNLSLCAVSDNSLWIFPKICGLYIGANTVRPYDHTKLAAIF